MPRRRQRVSSAQIGFLENHGRTAPAAPAIRQAVAEWRARGYPGASDTSRTLLNYWFHTDHKLPAGNQFRYYTAQQYAIESLIYVYEIARTRNRRDLYERFIPRELAGEIRLPDYDLFARYSTKMATGTGKTNVMALAIAWQYFNAVIEADADYSRTFLVIAPNIIVLERLRGDFSGGLVYHRDPVIPREFKIYWDMQFYMRGDAERASSEGAVYLTNIQQLYERESRARNEEPQVMTDILGKKPPADLNEEVNFLQRIVERGDSSVLVINDEAHHTHDPDLKWNEAIRGLHERHPAGISAQLDFSATPRYSNGALFAWTISDYTLKQAIVDRIVKRPVKGITDIGEISSSVPSVRYEPFIVAGIERWREYREALAPLGKKPLLFVMMNNTQEADAIGEYLRVRYPGRICWRSNPGDSCQDEGQ